MIGLGQEHAGAEDPGRRPADPTEPTVTSPGRFFRLIASIYELHAEVSEIALDEGARRRLAAELRFLRESLRETVSAGAYAELTRLDTPPGPGLTQDELRVTCSELLGWLIALLPAAERAAGRGRELEQREAGQQDAEQPETGRQQ
jgi:hypothetical protein